MARGEIATVVLSYAPHRTPIQHTSLTDLMPLTVGRLQTARMPCEPACVTYQLSERLAMTIEQVAAEAVVKIRPDSPLGSRSSCLEDPWPLSVPMIWRAVGTGAPSGWFLVGCFNMACRCCATADA